MSLSKMFIFSTSGIRAHGCIGKKWCLMTKACGKFLQKKKPKPKLDSSWTNQFLIYSPPKKKKTKKSISKKSNAQ